VANGATRHEARPAPNLGLVCLLPPMYPFPLSISTIHISTEPRDRYDVEVSVHISKYSQNIFFVAPKTNNDICISHK